MSHHPSYPRPDSSGRSSSSAADYAGPSYRRHSTPTSARPSAVGPPPTPPSFVLGHGSGHTSGLSRPAGTDPQGRQARGSHASPSPTVGPGAQVDRYPLTPSSSSSSKSRRHAAGSAAASAVPRSHQGAPGPSSYASNSAYHTPRSHAYGHPSHSYPHAHSYGAHTAHGGHDHRRAVSATPSSTSVSEGEGEDDGVIVSDEMRAWALRSTGHTASRGRDKGKGRARQEGEAMDVDGEGLVHPSSAQAGAGRVGIEDLPPEVLLHIFRSLPDRTSLIPLLLVNKQWSLFAYPYIWQKPVLNSPVQFASFVRVLNAPPPRDAADITEPDSPRLLHPYATAVKRLNLTSVASSLTDETFLGLRHATRVERLTLSGSSKISSSALQQVLASMPEIGSLDLSAGEDAGAGDQVTDDVLRTVATSCRKLQGLNLTRCRLVTDDGLCSLAAAGLALKRIRLPGAIRLTDASICALLRSSPLLLEIDLGNIPQLTNAATYAMCLHSPHVRELDLKGNVALTSEAFPNLPLLAGMQADEWEKAVREEPWRPRRAGISQAALWAATPTSATPARTEAASAPWTAPATSAASDDAQGSRRYAGWPVLPPPVASSSASFPSVGPAMSMSVTLDGPLRRHASTMEHLRVVDLYGCTGLGDDAVRNLVASAPKLRNLTLAKCPNLTDAAIDAICELGRHLHYLHLGHVALITDTAVVKLSKTCTRIRYIDLACCELLTDVAVFELAANLPKLRRIGLVKVTKITDEAIRALAERHDSLERIHLSYCDKVSVDAVTYLLNNLMSLTHLSLTGVSAFKKSELQQFCRPVPSNFNSHQTETFCVFSGTGINALRKHLNSRQAEAVAESDSSVHTRRNSASSTSSITLPGGAAEESWQDGEDGSADASQPTGSRARVETRGTAPSFGSIQTQPPAQAAWRDVSASRLSGTRSYGLGAPIGYGSAGGSGSGGGTPSSPGRATAMFATLALPPAVPRTPPPPELTTPPIPFRASMVPMPMSGGMYSPNSSLYTGSAPDGGGLGPGANTSDSQISLASPSAAEPGSSAPPNLSVYQTSIERPPEMSGPYFYTPISHTARPPQAGLIGWGEGSLPGTSSTSASMTMGRAQGGGTAIGPGPTSGLGSGFTGSTSPSAPMAGGGAGRKWFASLGRWNGGGASSGGSGGFNGTGAQ